MLQPKRTKFRKAMTGRMTGKAYRGGSFIVRAEYVTAAVTATLNSWKSQGVTVDGPSGSPISATRFGERLRSAIEGYPIAFEGEKLSVTVSVGVTAVPDAQVEKVSELVALADRALYDAKDAGRNCVRVSV